MRPISEDVPHPLESYETNYDIQYKGIFTNTIVGYYIILAGTCACKIFCVNRGL